jgi:peptidylprolyl isomerase
MRVRFAPPRTGLITLGAVLLLTAGCEGRSTVGQAGAVAVDGEDVRAILAALPEAERAALAQDQAALERVVRAELLRRTILGEARDAGYDKEVAIVEQLDRARDDALMRAWIAKQATVAKEYPSEQDLQAAYAANAARLAAPTQYRIAQIFVALPDGADGARARVALAKIDTVAARLEVGGDFAQLAREYSEHATSAANGGDVGLLPEDRMLPEVAAAARTLEVGAVGGPVKTAQGLHFVKLLERKTGVTPDFAASREALRAALRARRAQELQQAYLAAINGRVPATIDGIELDKLRTSLK